MDGRRREWTDGGVNGRRCEWSGAVSHPALLFGGQAVSASDSEESAAPPVCITGRFGNVEDRYCVRPRVLGTGHHGSVRECFDRATGVGYARAPPGLLAELRMHMPVHAAWHCQCASQRRSS